MNQSTTRTVYLTGDDQPLALRVHAADRVEGSDRPRPAVILCPPFGWEEIASYRGRREWAQRLAAAGHPTVRLTLPSTGESGGLPRDPGRVSAWTDAISRTAVWLRETGVADRVTAIGIGLGGLLAYRAVVDGAPIEDLVLWATPTRGRAVVRQMKAFARMQGAEFFPGRQAPEPAGTGELEAGGFVMSAETVAALESVDLAALSLPDPASRRVLLLGQDAISVDARLLDALTEAGVAVTEAAGDGFSEMTAPPQQAQPALATFARVQAWLDDAPSRPGAAMAEGSVSPAAADHALIDAGAGMRAREREFVLELGRSRLVGTLVEPEPEPDRRPDTCLVFFNAGAIYRVGPNRMWVEAARRWAARGVPSLRIDMEAIGDSAGDAAPYVADDALYTDVFVPQAKAVLDALHREGVAERFLLAGLCSGAYWALHTTLEHERAAGALLLNGVALHWNADIQRQEEMQRLRTGGLTWRRARRAMSPGRALRFAIWLLGQHGRGSADDDVIAAIGRSAKPILFVFGEGEPLRHALELSGRIERLRALDNVTVEYVAARDHTLRPGVAQREAHAAFDRAVERALGGTTPPLSR